MKKSLALLAAEGKIAQADIHGNGVARPRLLWLVVAVMIGFSAFVVRGQTSAKKAGLGVGDYEPNVPLVFLEARQHIVSEQKVPCTVKLVCPKGSESSNTISLPGVVRIHGATSQAYSKKSF